MLLLFTTSLALANDTGVLTYRAPSRSLLALEPGALAVQDGVGSDVAAATLQRVELAMQDSAYPVEPDLRCDTGAVGVLTLVELDLAVTKEVRGTRVTKRAFALASGSDAVQDSLVRKATRNGSVVAGTWSQQRARLDVGFRELVPAVEATATAVATARWVLTACDGTRVYDDLEQVSLSRSSLATEEATAMAQLDTDALRRLDVPAALSAVHHERFVSAGIEVERRYFDAGSPEMERARRRLRSRKREWTAAATAWRDASFSDNARTRAYALYNLALWYEHSGDLEAALESLEASLQAKRMRITRELEGILRARLRRQRATPV